MTMDHLMECDCSPFLHSDTVGFEAAALKPVMEPSALPSSICESAPELAIALKQHIKETLAQSPDKFPHVGDIACTTIQLPQELCDFPEDLQSCIRSRLLDASMQEALESTRVLNWCRNIRPLHALRTRGDGNCLLHAVSVAMWGMEDTSMFLRRLVYVALVEDEERGEIKKRWHKERGLLNDTVAGFRLSSGEWEQEWEIVVKAAEDQSVNDPVTRPRDLLYESLEEIHIFVLANVLKRPIIVLAEPMFRGTSGHSLAPNNLRGIYLPLLWKPVECTKSPIVLGFNSLHFAPLLSFKSHDASDVLEDACPLVSPQLESLYVHFLLPHEEGVIHRILQSYLNVQEVTHTREDGVSMILSAKLIHQSLPENFNLLASYMRQAKAIHEEVVSRKNPKVKTLSKKCVLCERNEAKDRYNGKCSFCYSTHSDHSFLTLSVADPSPSAPTQSIITHNTPSPSFIDELSWRHEPLTNTLVGPQDSPPLMFEGTSMVSQHCEYECCQNLASVKTYPYCHDHATAGQRRGQFQKQKSSSVSDECTSPLAEVGERRSLENTVFHVTGRGVPCREKGCKLYGLPEWDHRCSNHRSSPSTQKHSSTWQICRKTGCRKSGNAKYTGFCLECYTVEELPEESTTPSGQPIHWMKITSQNSLPSQNLTSQGPQCIGPQCKEQGQSKLKGLCEHCYQWLMEKPTANTPPQKCCTPKCKMYGVPEQRGHCSKCWKKCSPKCVVTPSSSLPDPEVKFCSGDRCDRYGDPNLRGFCSECYKRQILRKKSPKVVATSNQTFEIGTPPDAFKHTMREVEVLARKSKSSCRKQGCVNYGNPKAEGYCNGCYRGEQKRGRSCCDRL